MKREEILRNEYKVEVRPVIVELAKDLESCDWEECFDNPEQKVRRVFWGTVFALCPSRKYYQPFACSNVRPCSHCGGFGHIESQAKKLTRKRAKARFARLFRAAKKKFGLCTEGMKKSANRRNKAHRLYDGNACPVCMGVRSREAYLDELWTEAAEAVLSQYGLCLENGEGDPTDLFVVEYRDKD